MSNNEAIKALAANIKGQLDSLVLLTTPAEVPAPAVAVQAEAPKRKRKAMSKAQKAVLVKRFRGMWTPGTGKLWLYREARRAEKAAKDAAKAEKAAAKQTAV